MKAWKEEELSLLKKPRHALGTLRKFRTPEGEGRGNIPSLGWVTRNYD